MKRMIFIHLELTRGKSGVKPYPTRFPSMDALKCSRKHRPERGLCKKLRLKPCIIKLKALQTQLFGFVPGIFRKRSCKSLAAVRQACVTRFERSNANLFNNKG
jgi:hypothetical protein